jgi:2-polyprenyl-3-methyl-5-hydroxy-6-metoxy-1,4-benzoquinol methylase
MRFAFGKNWEKYSLHIREKDVLNAINSLKSFLQVDTLENQSFLDVGCGSGLFSLAAHKLGANVHSFDYDIDSVKTTNKIRELFNGDISKWTVSRGSILEDDLALKIGKFDVVYSWGVLHHTGNMWNSFDIIAQLVKNGGLLYVSIYNEQEYFSKYWFFVKKLYNKNFVLSKIITLIHIPYLILRYIKYIFTSESSTFKRGMRIYYDYIDWIGGFPFEYSKPDAVIEHFSNHGFILLKNKLVGNKHGCNEYLFKLNR